MSGPSSRSTSIIANNKDDDDNNDDEAHKNSSFINPLTTETIWQQPTTSTSTSLLKSSSSSQSLQKKEKEEMLSNRRKELFGDCALIEIIHLHDCLRGALKALESDVNHLVRVVKQGGGGNGRDYCEVADLERRVAGRFNVIWSVFRAHSSAEDEFIWPALQMKTKGRIKESPKYQPGGHEPAEVPASLSGDVSSSGPQDAIGVVGHGCIIEQEEYEEDHASEERMFSEMDKLLSKLRDIVSQKRLSATTAATTLSPAEVDQMAQSINEKTKSLSRHLMAHLEKEETQCMPLVVQHLSKSEIHELVGNIMGKRSADIIAQILTMAVQNLDEEVRDEMVKYMKQFCAGTFFDRWLIMSGWMSDKSGELPINEKKRSNADFSSPDNSSEDPSKKPKSSLSPSSLRTETCCGVCKHGAATSDIVASSISAVPPLPTASASRPRSMSMEGTTSQSELEKLIRAIASNPALTPAQKQTTIQGLRDSVWKSNLALKEKHMGENEIPTRVNESISPPGPSFPQSTTTTTSTVSVCRARRVTPPSAYYIKTADGKIELSWSSDGPSSRVPEDSSVPLFSAEELAPTYHDGAAGAVLGCPHYARNCKLRHPKSGRLYTCRLCCTQQRELPMRDQDEPLDRYEVREVMCMKCNALQPAEDRCFNPDCESRGKPYAKYFCKICHLYDDGSRPIFHCPYCNTCRIGLGLGIDFRHCMRCNACVSLSDDTHRCIPQKLQGDCPICHESLFQSTEPLRGLNCGHVMHLKCFTDYRRSQCYTCPLCMRSMEDMSDYFQLLDTAVRMQPMPSAYLSTKSNIYCQDCSSTGQVQYHFVGQKCPHCGSYNTRELGRVHTSPICNEH